MGHEFIVVNYFLVTGNVYVLFISDDSQFSELFPCFQEVLEQRDIQPLFVNVIFEEVCVDDLSYFACQPPTVISKFESHNYCSHITCFLNIYFLIFTKNCSIAYINTLFFLGCLFGNVDLPSSSKSQESFGLGPILPWEQWRTHGKVNCLITTFKFLSASKPRNIYLKTLQLMKTVMLKTLDIMFWSKSIC